MAAPYAHTSATFVPGGFDDDYYMPPPAPELVAPEPQRINPEMPAQIQDGLHHMSISSAASRSSYDYSSRPSSSPFPKLANKPPNVPPSDEELEATLENARPLVLSSNDPEMQLAWAADALVYVSVAADHEERISSANPTHARPSTPQIERQLKRDALNIVTFLADQHHPKAEFLRGQWLEWGRFGCREDKKEAFRCYSRAADRNYARAEYRIGMLYESYNDPVKALRHYHRGVEAGDAASCYRLGMMTLRGQHGQMQDFPRGVDLIRRSAQAADENAAQGAYVYGMLLARQLPQISVPENVLPYDESGARINVEKAAYLKFAKAQLKMASLYELGGLGCEFNPALSIHYNALASKQGEAEADMSLSKWFLVGSLECGLDKNEELAYTYAERAAQAGLATAEFALGYFHEIGMKVPVDLDKAVTWYTKASKHGNEDAQGRIDGIKHKQILSRKDHEQVAVKRITSMYGSQRGARPARFGSGQAGAGRMGSLAEQPYGTTTPPTAQDSYGRYSGGGPVQPPRSDSSATPTPYPLSDRPPTIPPPEPRSASVAPYPMEDGPPRQSPRPPPAGGFFDPSAQQHPPPMHRPATTVAPDLRPSSAFQINPEVRSNSTMTLPGQLPSHGGAGVHPAGNGRGNGGRPVYGPGSGPGPRPMTAQPLRPHDPATRPGGQRVASGSAGMQQWGSPRPSGRAEQGGAYQPMQPPGPAASPRPPPQQATGPGGPQPGKIDIGFSAPPDDRRSQTYGPQPGMGSKMSTPRPTPQSDGMPLPPNRQTTGTPSSSSSRPGSTRPQQPPTTQAGRGGATPKPPEKTSSSPAPGAPGAPAAKPTTAPTSSGAQAKPPGKGPKTFDEMGVPAQKQDSECTVM
ncbi:HCP-like protein [Hortaea werneckii]|nr:HCP-like protein [Hortaea werneckii]KAI7102011.1 HCP-like protein [Hortaea werneckii]KAI7219150.1 HCP-like protein [Hortaea werneckii]KAI7326522.1 HCP-like protein [Hortaea werneckii]KAI7387976.1 HCP-like protein [Hortaea werneckii]